MSAVVDNSYCLKKRLCHFPVAVQLHLHLSCSGEWFLRMITIKSCCGVASPLLCLSVLFSPFFSLLCSLPFAVLGGARARPKCPTQRYLYFPCPFWFLKSCPLLLHLLDLFLRENIIVLIRNSSTECFILASTKQFGLNTQFSFH